MDQFFRVLLASFFILFLILPEALIAQTTYTYNRKDNSNSPPSWTEPSLWDTYPGTTINAGDEVIIYGRIGFAASELTNNGTITFKTGYKPDIGFRNEEGDLTLNNATLVNNGTINIESGGAITFVYSILQNNNTLNNNGTINSYDGFAEYGSQIHLNNGSYFNNTHLFYNGEWLFIHSGATLSNIGGLYNQSDETDPASQGEIFLESGGNLTLHNDFWLPDRTTWYPGGKVSVGFLNTIFNIDSDFTIPLNSTLEVVGKISIETGVSLTVPATATLELDGTTGLSQVLNTSTGKNETIVREALVTNNGSITIDNGATLHLINDADLINTAGNSLTNNGTIVYNSNEFQSFYGHVPESKITNQGTFVNNGVYTLNYGGALENSGAFNNYGSIAFNESARLANTGTITNFGSSNYIVNTTSFYLNSGEITGWPTGVFNWNSGTVTIGTEADLNLPANLTVGTSNTLNIKGKATNSSVITVQGEIKDEGDFVNSGTVNISSGGNLHINKPTFSLPSGSVNYEIGSITTIGINSTLSITNTFSIAAGNTLVNKGNLTIRYPGVLTANGVFQNDNDLTFEAGELVLNSAQSNLGGGTVTYSNTGKITVNAGVTATLKGDITIPLNSSLTNNGTITIPSGNTLTIDGDISNNGTIEVQSNGTYALNKDNTLGNFVWQPGGIFNLGSDISTFLSTSFTIPQNSTFVLGGEMVVSGTTFTISDGSTLILNPTANIRLVSNAILSNKGDLNNHGVINNFAVINQESGSTLTHFPDATFLNSGSINLNNASLVLKNSFETNGGINEEINWTNGGLFQVDAGVTYTSKSDFTIPVNGVLKLNGGFFSKSTITNNGEVELNTGGTFSLEGLSTDVLNNLTWNGGHLMIGPFVDITKSTATDIKPNSKLTVQGKLTVPSLTLSDTVDVIQKTSYLVEAPTGNSSEFKTGNLIVNGALELNSPIYVGGNLELNGATQWNTNGGFVLGSESDIKFNSTIEIPSGYNLVVSNTLTIGNSGVLTNNGTLSTAPSATSDLIKNELLIAGKLINNGSITNNSEFRNIGIVELISGSTFTHNLSSSSYPTKMENSGDFILFENSTATFNGSATNYGMITNGGSIYLSKQLLTDGDIINNSVFEVAAGGDINNSESFVNNGSLTVLAGAEFLNAELFINSITGKVYNFGTLKSYAFQNDIQNYGLLENSGEVRISTGIQNSNNAQFIQKGWFIFENSNKLVVNTGARYQITKKNDVFPLNFTWNNGGIVEIIDTASVLIADGFSLESGAILDLKGLATIETGNTATLNAGSSLLLKPQGTLSIAENGIMINKGVLEKGGTITNAGELSVTDGGNLKLINLNTEIPKNEFSWNTGGILEIGSTASTTLIDSLKIPTGSTLKISGSLINNSVISNAGKIDYSGVIINNGVIDLNAASSFYYSNTTDSLLSGTFNWNSNANIVVPTGSHLLINKAFTIPATDSLIIDGNLSTNSEIFNNGTLQLGSTAEYILTGAEAYFPSGNIDWKGKLIVKEGSSLEINQPTEIEAALFMIINGSLINNSSLVINGNVEVRNTGDLTNYGSIEVNSFFTTIGPFNLESGSKLLLNNEFGLWPSYNFNWKMGSSVVIGPTGFIETTEALTIPEGRILEVNGLLETYGELITVNGILKGTGSTSAVISTGETGVFSPGNLNEVHAELTNIGNVNFGEARYKVEIDAVNDKTDNYSVEGIANLSQANLDIEWTEVPNTAGSFSILSYTDKTGEFDSWSAPFVNGFEYNLEYKETELVLHITSVPLSVKPVTNIQVPKNVGSNSISISGDIDPGGAESSFYVEYGESESALTNSSEPTELISKNTIQNISKTISGLNYGTLYFARIISNNGVGTDSSAIQSFVLDSTFLRPNLQLWLRADEGAAIESNASVSEWRDISGNLNHAIQTSNISQPTKNLDVINGKSAIRFDGLDDFMSTSTALELGLNDSALEVFIVAKSSSATSETLVSSEANQYALSLNSNNSGITARPGNYSNSFGTIGEYSNNQAHIFSYYLDENGMYIRVDGTSSGNAISGSFKSSDQTTLSFGIDGSGANNFSGDIAEVLIFNRVLSSSERSTIDSTLSVRYLISGTNLPVKQSTTQLEGTEGWRLLSSNVGSTTIKNLLTDRWTQGFSGAKSASGSANFYTWGITTNDNSVNNWVSASDVNQEIKAGSGALVYLFSDDNGPSQEGDSGFPKSMIYNGIEPQIDVNVSSNLNTNNSGWTLLGNPFRSYIDWDLIQKEHMNNTVYTWDNKSSSWLTWNGSIGSLIEGKISPMQGFFTVTNTSDIESNTPSFIIPVAAKTTAPVLEKGVNKQEFNDQFSVSLELQTQTGLKNEAWVSFNEYSSDDFDEFDAYELVPYSSSYIQLGTVSKDNSILDINSRTIPTSQIEIPLQVNSTENGKLTLSVKSSHVPESWELLIRENGSGKIFNLNDSYSFDVTRVVEKKSRNYMDINPVIMNQEIESRFSLIINPGISTSLEFEQRPTGFVLAQNYPNPFNPSTTITYSIEKAGNVTILVYNLMGQKVVELVNEQKAAGSYNVIWDASSVSNGMYFYQLNAGGKSITRKMTLIK
ncbi:MAG: hypothetical protein BalsKO_06730 [Balneolaceae bacterium]